MKNYILFFGIFLLSITIHAQEVIATQGDSYTNGGNTIDFTIGETVIETVSGINNRLTQGFHQTLLTVTSVEDLDVTISVTIFPNPTSEDINLVVDKYEGVTFSLYDVVGKLLTKQTLTATNTNINISTYSKGVYLLKLSQKDNNKIKTYRIIKK